MLGLVPKAAHCVRSIEHGNFAANVVIQRSGCTFPKHAPTQNRALCHPDQPARTALGDIRERYRGLSGHRFVLLL